MRKLLSFLVILAAFTYSAQIHDYSDSEIIQTALNSRDDFYTRLLGDFTRNGYPSSQETKNRLRQNSEKNSPWYSLLYAQSSNSSEEKNHYFKRAISASEDNIGNLWVLFIEFHKIGERELENTVLNKIESISLSNGIEVLPSIAEQLTLLAAQEHNRGNYENAQYYLENSKRFTNVRFARDKSLLTIPNSETKLFTLTENYKQEFRHSWRAQLTALEKGLLLFQFILILVTLTLFSILCFKYFPQAIHNLSCLYPKSVPYQMRFFFSILILLVSVTLGIYPLAVFIVILLNRLQLEKAALISARILLVLLFIIPLPLFITARIGYTLSQNSPISKYEQALQNQPTPTLYASIKREMETSETPDKIKALHYTSMALIQFKRGSVNSAVALIRKAYPLWEDSEPILLAAGTIYHRFGDTDQAFKLYKKANELFPESPQINYNYGQINLEQVGITDGTDFINRGAELAPMTVNGFINRNSKHFGESGWPPARLFFMGAISPATFWENFWVFTAAPKGMENILWGSMFWGLPLPVSLGAIIAAIIISSLIVPSYTQMKKSGECTLCGKPVCQKCRVNDICNECNGMLQNITNDNLINSIKVKLADSKRKIILWKAHLVDIILPGSRDLFLKKKSKKRVFILLPITMLIYISYFSTMLFTYNLIPSIDIKIRMLILSPAIAFNLAFVVLNIKHLIVSLKKSGK